VQGDKKEFLHRVIPLTLDDAKFSSWRDRVVFAEYWQNEFEEMEKKIQHLGGPDLQLYKSAKDWHNRVGDMLAYVNDRLHPHGFEQIVKDDFAGLMQMLGGPDVRARNEEERRYLARLIAEIETKARLYSPLAGVARTRPNLTALDPWKDEPGIELLIKHQARTRDREEQQPGHDYDDILTAFKKVNRTALLGAPGSGKSTTLRKLALELAHQALADDRAPIPLLVSLGEWIGDEPLSEFLAVKAPEAGGVVEGLAKAGRLVLLLDGLNEMPTAKRAKKAADIRAFCTKLEKINPKTAIVGSCRKEDYAGDLDLGLDTLTLEPLSPQRIRAVLQQWVAERGQSVQTAERLFWQLAGDERLSGVFEKWEAAGASEEVFWTASSPQDEREVYAQTNGEDDRLWTEHIPNPRSLLKLASNPFMLTMLF
jgi:energy-coupling factor transporter ATP-binding protein EcfA2